MDNMLIWWTICFLCLRLRSTVAIIEDSSFLKNDSSFKAKRQSDFNFDASLFEGPGLFGKAEDFKTLVDDEDFSAFLPQGGSKAVRNSPIYGTKNPKSAENSADQSTQQASPSNVNLFSDEAPGSANPALQTTPYFKDFLSQPIIGKGNPYSNENPYKPPLKKPIGTYPAYPGLPIYNSYSSKSTNNQQIFSPKSPYKAPLLPGLKKITYPHKVYAPLNRYSQLQQPIGLGGTFQTFGQPSTTPDFPSFYRGSESSPVLYSSETGLPYKPNEPGFNIYNNYNKPKKPNLNSRSGVDTPFFSQEAFAQFPSFNSPRNQFPGRSAFPNDYQEFKLQPQLHFNQNRNNEPKSYKPVPHGSPFERIRSDVEIIDKTKPIPPHGKDSKDADDGRDAGAEDDASTDDLSNEEPKDTKYSSYFPKTEEDPDEDPQNFEEPEPEAGFKPSDEYPFKEYDSKFGNPRNVRKNPKDEEDNADNPKIDLAAKFRYLDERNNPKQEEAENDSVEGNPYANSKAESDDDFQVNYDVDVDEDDEKAAKLGQVANQKKPKASNKGYNKEYKRNYKKDKFKSLLHSAESNSRYRQEKPSKLPKKNSHRTYRDKTGERSPALIDPNWSFPSKHDQKFDSSQVFSKESETKSSPNVWGEDSYMKAHGKDDDMSLYSREVAAPGKKNKHSEFDEYTTRASFKTSTVPAKDVFNSFGGGKSGLLRSNFLDTWHSGSNMNMNFGDDFDKPKKKSTFGNSDFFKQDFGRKEIFASLRGI